MNDFFVAQLLAWFDVHKRDLPWRHTQNPYFIWLSEIILQQTRIAQGLPYYENFVKTFPTITDLAQADQEQVLRLWQGLGYYSRARNMHQTAQEIFFEKNSLFPNNFSDLKKLKGIGDYTAAAIASFAFDEKVAVVDGNVFRVLSRFFGIEQDIASGKGKKYFQEFAQAILPTSQTATYNQAIMEFGALHCSPQKPDCLSCVLQPNCVAFAQNKQSRLPIKTKKINTKDRFFDYLVFFYKDKFLLKVRTEGDIWQGLYDFCLVENQNCPPFLSDLYAFCVQNELFFGEKTWKNTVLLKDVSATHRHLLSHQRIFAKFYLLEISEQKFLEQLKNTYLLQEFDREQIQNLPKPILIANYVEKNLFKIFV